MPATYRKNVQWAVDFDYVEKLRQNSRSTDPVLAQEALDAIKFLSQFAEEYYSNRLNKYGSSHFAVQPKIFS